MSLESSPSHGHDQAPQPERAASKKKKPRDIVAILRRIPDLPDEAIIPDAVAAIILNISPRSLRRNKSLPRVRIGQRMGGRQLGAIRKLGRSAT